MSEKTSTHKRKRVEEEENGSSTKVPASSNLRISSISSIPSPADIVSQSAPSAEAVEFVNESRKTVEDILSGVDKRILIVLGPCSIHNADEALDYGKKLLEVSKKFPNLFIVMRVYFEKPRTRVGWKGLVYDPFLDGSDQIEVGIRRARKLLLELTNMRIPIAGEFLDVITPQYIADLVSWGAIGARTTESQVHRQLASGLSMPVGFKNLTSGNWLKAIDGVLASTDPHSFLSTDFNGRIAHVKTMGNPACHIVLRGGEDPNYHFSVVKSLSAALEKEKIKTGIMIDCSHSNSGKNHLRQALVAVYSRRMNLMNQRVCALMIESNINPGRQNLVAGTPLKPGLSITDACIGWESTVMLLQVLDEMSLVNVSTLEEARVAIRQYDDLIRRVLEVSDISSMDPLPPLPSQQEKVHVCVDQKIAEVCASFPGKEEYLSVLLSQRMALSEGVAAVKFKSQPFDFLLKANNMCQLVTHLSVELGILGRASNLTDGQELYLRILDLSKSVQSTFLEEVVREQRIGYPSRVGGITQQVLSDNFRGQYIACTSEDLMYRSLLEQKIDFGFLPIHNTTSGPRFQLREDVAEIVGTFATEVNLSLVSNRQDAASSSKLRLYLTANLKSQVEPFLRSTKVFKFSQIEMVERTSEAVIRVMQDSEAAATISAQAEGLYCLQSNLVSRNVTTYAVIRLREKNIN